MGNYWISKAFIIVEFDPGWGRIYANTPRERADESARTSGL